MEKLFVALQGGTTICKIGFKNAYNQLLLNEETSSLSARNTHKTIFLVNRLPYGTKLACAIF